METSRAMFLNICPLACHFTHLFRVTGDDIITHFFWIQRPDMMQQTPVRGSVWIENHLPTTEPSLLSLSVVFLVSLMSSRCLDVPQVPPQTISSTTGDTTTEKIMDVSICKTERLLVNPRDK